MEGACSLPPLRGAALSAQPRNALAAALPAYACTRHHAHPHHSHHSRRALAEAKSDLLNVLSSLEAHWHVLEAEVVEINRDIEYCEQCLRKYGEWFNSPLQYLRVRAHPQTRPEFAPVQPCA